MAMEVDVDVCALREQLFSQLDAVRWDGHCMMDEQRKLQGEACAHMRVC
jgi:hypothetical protein